MITGTHHQGTEDEKRALAAYIKLLRATEAVTARVNGIISEAGLSVSQFGVIEALYHLGPLCQKDLARKILKSSGNLTMVIDNLEKRGLVRRERGEDRRYLTIHLTAEGKELIAGIFPRHAAGIVREMAALTPHEQDELARLCRKLGLR